MHKSTIILIFTLLLMAVSLSAQNERSLSLPNLEQLSSQKVLHLLQDSEGFLWYATEGGGVCRDDGRQVDVFRSDAEHPDLLGSNNVVCLAELGRRIIIGTFHGAYVLDKRDYSISRLKDVDDKRVDDILVTTDGHMWLTANKKIFEYSAECKLLNIYPVGDKYIFRLHEDAQGRVCCTEWEGGTLRLDGGRFKQVTTAWPDSISFSRVMTDRQGRQLVSDGFGQCHAISNSPQRQWFQGTILTKEQADSIRLAWNLSTRPTAIAQADSSLYFSTGKDIRCKNKDGEEMVISPTKDVSAMAFTIHSLLCEGRGGGDQGGVSLWQATIYGQLYRYHDGKTETDDYGSNEYGDGVIAMSVDSLGRLILVCDRYTRIYDPKHRTLRQQSREADGVYCIELQETKPGERWSQPNRDKVVERMPQWIWWMLAILVLTLSLLTVHVLKLRKQRKRFLEQLKNAPVPVINSPSETIRDQGALTSVPDVSVINSPSKIRGGQGALTTAPVPVPVSPSSWLNKAIAQVEAHLSDEGYTVEQLSSDMCMSRMTFYRKIQSATGHTPTEFMRTIRLRRAAEMLQEARLTVTEISYATGFSSVSYFSRCFRAMYGVPPTQYGTQHQA